MNKAYIVTLEGGYCGQTFKFDNFEDAAAFIKNAIEHTEYSKAAAEIEIKELDPEPNSDEEETI